MFVKIVPRRPFGKRLFIITPLTRNYQQAVQYKKAKQFDEAIDRYKQILQTPHLSSITKLRSTLDLVDIYKHLKNDERVKHFENEAFNLIEHSDDNLILKGILSSYFVKSNLFDRSFSILEEIGVVNVAQDIKDEWKRVYDNTMKSLSSDVVYECFSADRNKMLQISILQNKLSEQNADQKSFDYINILYSLSKLQMEIGNLEEAVQNIDTAISTFLENPHKDVDFIKQLFATQVKIYYIHQQYDKAFPKL